MFVCEATSQDSDEIWEGHLRASQTGRIAQQVGYSQMHVSRIIRRSLERLRAVAEHAA